MNNSPPASSTSARQKLAAIAVRSEAVGEGACEESGLVALQVLGDSMRPEFDDGDIIVVEPDGRLADGVYVVAQSSAGWTLRLLRQDAAGWALVALSPDDTAPAVEPIADLSCVRGVVIQKSKPGRRRSVKRYVE